MYYREFAILLFGILFFAPTSVILSQNSDTSFSFSLRGAARTSAGIYKSDGTLIRTLWSGVSYNAGTYKLKWDGTDDNRNAVEDGNYSAKIVSNNVNYEWEGVIGNTSDTSSGTGVHRGYLFMTDMCIAGGYIYYTTPFNETTTSQHKASTAKPNTNLTVAGGGNTNSYLVASDGTNVYWATKGRVSGDETKFFVLATKVSDDSRVTFSSGTDVTLDFDKGTYSCFGYAAGLDVRDMAVQNSHNYIFIAEYVNNHVLVYNKITGALTQTLSFNKPKGLAVDSSDNIWIISGTNSIAKYIVNSNGTLSSTVVTLTGLANPQAIDAPANGSTLIITDSATQQLKAYNINSGIAAWTYGTSGGYASSRAVADNKFFFAYSSSDRLRPFVAIASDTSFWIGDNGNSRAQHYTSGRSFIDRIMFLPHSYNTHVDYNNTTRVFSDYLEFAIDYKKSLRGTNASWILINNWGFNIPSDYVDTYVLRGVATLNNGRTYATQYKISTSNFEIVELTPSGIRYTGVMIPSDNTQLYPDGSLRKVMNFSSGSTTTWSRKSLTGFDGSGNPLWGSFIKTAFIDSASSEDPFYWGNGTTLKSGDTTSSGVLISFDGGLPPAGGNGYHLGGIKNNKFLWKTAYVTHSDYHGDYPIDGRFDIGNYNGDGYPGGTVSAIEKSIFWNYHGEFWKQSQTNKWQHVYDNGLLLGVFGVTRDQFPSSFAANPGMAGNVICGPIVRVDTNYYLYHNDESVHSGIHRWKITNLSSIQEQLIPLTDSFKRTNELSILPGTDLMKGLPFNSVLLNNTSGWTRMPAEEDSTNYDRHWSVKTNVKTYDKRKSPDLWISYDHIRGPYFVNRDLGVNIDVSAWDLTGEISYENNSPNEKSGTSMYFHILDDKGKILLKFYTTAIYGANATFNIYANNTIVHSGTIDEVFSVTNVSQFLSVSMERGAMIVKYADYVPIMVKSFDSTGNLANPKTMQLYFNYDSSGGLYQKLIGLDQFRFSIKSGNKPVYRINAGGGDVTTSQGIFFKDAYYSPSAGNTYSTISLIEKTTDDAIYQSERTDTSRKFGYKFPVSNGHYSVVLHFAEIYYKTIGYRVFDVDIEGVKVLDNYDIVKKVGSFTATNESFGVDVSDGILNIEFSSLKSDGGQDLPKISAIEILSDSNNKAPIANAGADKSVNLPVNFTVLNGSATDSDGSVKSYKWTQLSGPNLAIFNKDTTAAPTVTGLIQGTYVFSIVARDNLFFPSVADEMTLSVNPASTTGTTIYRINAGGGEVNTSKGVFSADNYFSPATSSLYSDTSGIAGTLDDKIYQTERTNSTGKLSYTFPVANGQYSVILHFSEIYYKRIGNRLFDVTVEGTKILDDYDIFKKAGGFTATTENFGVNVTDGFLNIDFSSLAVDGGTDWPKVSAIEVIGYSSAQQTVASNLDEKGVTIDLLNNFSVTIQPNPSNHYFNFYVTGRNQPVNIKIVNAIGQVVETRSNVIVQSPITLGNSYHPGLYYAVIQQGVNKLILKFIKRQ